VDDGLVPPKVVGVALKDINALVCMVAHGKDTSEHLQNAEVSIGGGRGTATVSSARRNCIQRRRGVSPDRNLGKSRTKRLMGNILHKVLMGHYLDHTHDVGSKSTRSERVD
jgi:hypothetical protein